MIGRSEIYWLGFQFIIHHNNAILILIFIKSAKSIVKPSDNV